MRMKMMWVASLVALSLGSVVSCGGKNKGGDTAGGGSAMATDKPLYDRLGGKDAITKVVDDFVGNVVADARINTFFKNADAVHLKAMLVAQICEATGGPCKYTGKDMKTSHAGMGIKSADFDALVEDLKKSLDKFNVPAKEQGELLGALAALKPDIVTS